MARKKNKPKKVFVTGSSGFIGKEVVAYLVNQGHEVVTLSRKPFLGTPDPRIMRHLGEIRDISVLKQCLQGVEVVIHLAGAKNDEPNSYGVNVGGAKALVSACKETGISRIINVSTASASLKRLGTYGKTKLEAEKVLADSGLKITNLRPSIVYGDSTSGILGTIVKATKKKIVPIIGYGKTKYRPIHVKDLAQILFECIENNKTIGKTYTIGGPDLISFREIIEVVGSKFNNTKNMIIHIPVKVGLLVTDLSTKIMKKPLVTKSNVLGLIQSADLDISNYDRDFDLRPRTFLEGLREIIFTESQNKEAKLLYAYLLSNSEASYVPDQKDIDDYNAALKVNSLRINTFSDGIYKNQFILGALDAFSKLFFRNSTIQKKIAITAVLIETSPISARWLLPKSRSVLRLSADALVDSIRAMLKLSFGIFIFLFFRRFFIKNVV